MAKYLFIYRTLPEDHQPSPEEMQALMENWQGWFQKVGEALVDGGDGLLPTGRLLHPDGAVTDGPFIEAKELVGGYSILQAETYDQAVEHARSCPIVQEGGTIEIRELAGFG